MKKYIRSTFYTYDFKNIPITDDEHILFKFIIKDSGWTGAYIFDVVADSTDEAESMFIHYLNTVEDIVVNGGYRTSGETILRVWDEQKRIHTGGYCSLETVGVTSEDKGVYTNNFENHWYGSDHLWD